MPWLTSSWDILFLAAAVTELLPGCINSCSTAFLFPGANCTGVLAGEMWNAAAMTLGFMSAMCVYVGTANDNLAKLVVAIGIFVYHQRITLQTIKRVIHQQQVDGPNTTGCTACRCVRLHSCGCASPQTENYARGVLSILIHETLAVSSVIFMQRNTQEALIAWYVLGGLVILAGFAAECNKCCLHLLKVDGLEDEISHA